MSTEEKRCECEGCSCEINQKTVDDTMRKLGFDKVLQQEDVLAYGGMPMWPDTSGSTPYEGVPPLTLAPAPCKPSWYCTRYSMGIRCGESPHEKIARSMASIVCFAYIRLHDVPSHVFQSCMDKETCNLDPIEVHRLLDLGDEKMVYAVTGFHLGPGDFHWGVPPKEGERSFRFQMLTPPDLSEHASRQL